MVVVCTDLVIMRAIDGLVRKGKGRGEVGKV